jgi:hypothetical protein
MSAPRLPGQTFPSSTEPRNRASHASPSHCLTACLITTQTGSCLVRCVLDRTAVGVLGRKVGELCQLAASLVQLGGEIQDHSVPSDPSGSSWCAFHIGDWEVHARRASPLVGPPGIGANFLTPDLGEENGERKQSSATTSVDAHGAGTVQPATPSQSAASCVTAEVEPQAIDRSTEEVPHFLILLITKKTPGQGEQSEVDKQETVDSSKPGSSTNHSQNATPASVSVQRGAKSTKSSGNKFRASNSVAQAKSRLPFNLSLNIQGTGCPCWPKLSRLRRDGDRIDTTEVAQDLEMTRRPSMLVNLDEASPEQKVRRDAWLRQLSLDVQLCFVNRFQATLADDLRADLASVEAAASNYVLGRGGVGERTRNVGRTLPQYQQFQDVELKLLLRESDRRASECF